MMLITSLLFCRLARASTKKYFFNGKLLNAQLNPKFNFKVASFSTSSYSLKKKKIEKHDFEEEMEKQLVRSGFFQIDERNKKTYLATIDLFKEKSIHLRGYVEFIYTAMKYMEEFGVEKDLETYKKLLNVMPKGKLVSTNMFQAMFMHYPKQQFCAIDLLEKMEHNRVLGDKETENILLNIFGFDSHPVKKFRRMMYWMPKFKYASPWLLPDPVPDNALELAKLAIARILSVDPAAVIEVLQTNKVEDSIDDTWIVGGLCPKQEELLKKHPVSIPLKVEGPFRIFLRQHMVSYFVLRSEYIPEAPPEEDPDSVTSFYKFIDEHDEESTSLMDPVSVHEQEDGTIYAVCATGTSSRDSTLSWIRLLSEKCPKLEDCTILFESSSPIGPVLEIDKSQDENLPDTVSPK